MSRIFNPHRPPLHPSGSFYCRVHEDRSENVCTSQCQAKQSAPHRQAPTNFEVFVALSSPRSSCAGLAKQGSLAELRQLDPPFGVFFLLNGEYASDVFSYNDTPKIETSITPITNPSKTPLETCTGKQFMIVYSTCSSTFGGCST